MGRGVEAAKQRLRDERRCEQLQLLRNRSTSFVLPLVPQTTFTNVYDVTRGQLSARNNVHDGQVSARGTPRSASAPRSSRHEEAEHARPSVLTPRGQRNDLPSVHL